MPFPVMLVAVGVGTTAVNLVGNKIIAEQGRTRLQTGRRTTTTSTRSIARSRTPPLRS